jgi:hypothetical protein
MTEPWGRSLPDGGHLPSGVVGATSPAGGGPAWGRSLLGGGLGTSAGRVGGIGRTSSPWVEIIHDLFSFPILVILCKCVILVLVNVCSESCDSCKWVTVILVMI